MARLLLDIKWVPSVSSRQQIRQRNWKYRADSVQANKADRQSQLLRGSDQGVGRTVVMK